MVYKPDAYVLAAEIAAGFVGTVVLVGACGFSILLIALVAYKRHQSKKYWESQSKRNPVNLK